MADAVSHTPKPQTLAPSDPANPSKYFFSNFLYKSALVTVFLVLLPFFPSLAPEFVNQTLHARSWELLQIIFVGIAVSYGLFSKKNDETEKDHIGSSKLDNAQSYVSKLLQVSSVFDDESDDNSHALIEENRIQTLNNSQYYRGVPPVVVVAKEISPVVNGGENGEITQKPLLLPVRSLKQRVSDPNEVDLGDGKSSSINRSSSGSKRFTSNLRKSRNVEVGGLSFEKSEEDLEENVVLRSPIPWRTRSGRIEMKENGDGPPSFSLDEPELNRVESRSFRSSSKNLSIPKKLSPSASFSSESQAKITEDVVRKKKNSSSPPPAPPPPPPFLRKSVMVKSNSSVTNDAVSPEKVLRRSVRSVPAEELSESEVEETPGRMNVGLELRGRTQNDSLAKSVRTYRYSELLEKNSMDYENKFVEKKGYTDTMMNEKFTNETTQTMETSDDELEGETEDDFFDENPGNGKAVTDNSNTNGGNDVGPDVDKKADEFIAKFREQIRLQRIESIRRSTAQRAGKTFR
ncbi:hypothetical protein DH2020_005257 [Rehmannia glutinosa]|uniref:Uncharacterized protein n=1 Tax=Rehmannia glutinosa TaxID=99300 RepID=A0ABR0XG63_REHGL